MDLETIIIALLATAVFLVPIIYIQRKQKANAGKAKQDFLEAASRHGIRLGQHDFWNGQFGIGLDEAQHCLFYWYKSEHKPQEVLVDLHAIKQSAVENVHHEVNGNRIIDSISLRIALHEATSPDIYLPFYTKGGDRMLIDELRLAQKWHGLLLKSTVTGKAVQV